MKFIVPFLALVVVVGLVRTPLRADEKPEPRYEGKSQGYWICRLQDCETDQDRQAAAKALKAFGPDLYPGAVDRLVTLLDDRSPEFRHS